MGTAGHRVSPGFARTSQPRLMLQSGAWDAPWRLWTLNPELHLGPEAQGPASPDPKLDPRALSPCRCARHCRSPRGPLAPAPHLVSPPGSSSLRTEKLGFFSSLQGKSPRLAPGLTHWRILDTSLREASCTFCDMRKPGP